MSNKKDEGGVSTGPVNSKEKCKEISFLCVAGYR